MSGILGATPTYDAPPPVPIEKPATLGEVFSASRVLARADRMDAQSERLRKGFEPLLAEINADRVRRGLDPLDNPGHWDGDVDRRPSASGGPFDFGAMFTDRVSRRQQQARIFAELREIRRRDPGFLAGVPETAEAFGQALIAREQADRAQARGTLGRSGGVLDTLTGFAGGVVETMQDPVNLLSLPLGGGGKTILSQTARAVLVNGGLELIQQPQVMLNREELGEELTAGEAALNVGFAAAGGVIGDVVLPRAVKGVADGMDAAYRRLRPGGDVARALARADLPDDALAATFRELVPEPVRSFDERAAINIITRETEVRGASPFVPTAQGLDAHAARLQAAIDRLLATPAGPSAPPAGRVAAIAGSAVPSVAMQFRAILGLEGGVDRAGNFRTSPAGAIGPAQVMPDTAPEAAKLAGLPFDDARYRSDAAYNRALGEAYYREQLRVFGDPDKAAAAYNAGPGRLRDAMRKAADAGEPDNWEKYLPAETQAYVRGFRERTGLEASRGVELDEAGEIVARPAALDAVREGVDLPARVEIDVPELRRDQFADDVSWEVAQIRADAAARGASDMEVASAIWGVALRDLRARRDGEFAGALHHPELGSIDVKWGTPGDPENGFKGGYGLAHIEAKHPDVVDDLQAVIGGMRIRAMRSERIDLESADHRAGVALTWYEKDQQWLVTAFRRDEAKSPAGSYSRREPESGGTDNSRPGAETNIAQDAASGNAAPRAAAPEIEPVVRDALDAAAPSLVPPRQLELFDDPAGEGAALQADSLAHDLRARIDAGDAGGAYRLEDGSEKTAAEILADLDEDEAMIAAIRGCL